MDPTAEVLEKLEEEEEEDLGESDLGEVVADDGGDVLCWWLDLGSKRNALIFRDGRFELRPYSSKR